MKVIEQVAVWGQHAGQWSRVGPPLKPADEDTALTLSMLQPLFAENPDQCRIAVLGVTPELVQMPWPAQVQLDAFDHSADMIARVWRAHPAVRSQVHEADWRALPLEAGSLDGAVGDGCLNTLPTLDQYSRVLQELHRVLAAHGKMVLRCFIRPDKAETVPAIVDAVMAGQVGSFHALKWRLAMALADVGGGPVAVADIHQAFDTSFPSRAALSDKTGWPLEQIDTIDAYQGSPTHYTFPTLDQLRKQCQPWFDVMQIAHGNYELADRCPTLAFARKASGERGE